MLCSPVAQICNLGQVLPQNPIPFPKQEGSLGLPYTPCACLSQKHMTLLIFGNEEALNPVLRGSFVLFNPWSETLLLQPVLPLPPPLTSRQPLYSLLPPSALPWHST